MVVRKRKAPAAGSGDSKKKKKPLEAALEEQDIASGSESSDDEKGKQSDDDAADAFFEAETPDEKRVRLAKDYLKDLGGTKQPEEVSAQLAHDVEEAARRARFSVEDLSLGEPRYMKGHKMCPTCVCLSADERTLYSGGKDCAIIRWDVETGKKDVFPGWRNCFDIGGHFEQVMDLCLLEQRGLLASVGVDRVVRLWDHRAPAGTKCVDKLLGHNGTITACAADPDGAQVYTASLDKSVKIWDMTNRRCIDTLFGNVSGVVSMDLHHKNRPLTGGADKTVRLWKVDKDTHLMFNRHSYSVDAVAMLDQERFLSGSQDGSLNVWTSASKKPLCSTSLGGGQWCTALASVRSGNVIFSGSDRGTLQAWRLSKSASGKDADGKETKGLSLKPTAAKIEAPGCINAIAVGNRVLACAVGKEHKLGRWHYDKKQRMGLMLVPLSYRED